MAPVVILDPGHGGTQAYGGSSPHGVADDGGLSEKQINLELARRVAARLGSLAQLTRDGDVNVSLRERAQLAARSGARVLISLHANSGTYGTRGTEIWLHDAHQRRSVDLARSLHGNLERVGPVRGVFQGPLAVLDPRDTGDIAACLIEADYLSDPEGRRRLTSPRGLDDLAQAISTGVRSYLGNAGLGDGEARIARGLPNLNFGPPGLNNRPVGAVVVMGTPVQRSPVQIMWTDFNQSDTVAGSYHDDVWVVDAQNREVFRERIRASGLADRGSEPHYVVWTPQSPGDHTVHVRLNTGDYAIPEDRIDDNESQISTKVVAASYGDSRRFGAGLAVREVNGPDSLSARYIHDQNLGSVTFYGYMRRRSDFTNRYIWLVWPRRRQPSDPACSVDIDLMVDTFDRDPQIDQSATPIDAQTRRIQLGEGQRFGYEFSRLPEDIDTFYVRVRFTDYGQDRNAGELLWLQGYG